MIVFYVTFSPNEKTQILRPQQVEGKWDQTTITQIACGRYHVCVCWVNFTKYSPFICLCLV